MGTMVWTPGQARGESPRGAAWYAWAVLLGILVVVFGGGMPFLILWSPALLYGTYLLILGCAAVLLLRDWEQSRRLLPVGPYLGWLLFYFFWGTLVAEAGLSVGEVGKVFVKNLLVIGAVALVFRNESSARALSHAFALAAVLNAALAVYESANPTLIETLALERNPDATAFSVLRPAGIWINPDEAAFSYIFALLLLHWSSRWVAWPAGIACLVGLFLSASRTGAYVTLLCGAVYVGFLIRTGRIGMQRLGWILLLGGALLAGLMGLGELGDRIDLSNQWQLTRMLDFSEEKLRDPGDASRIEIALESAEHALDGPWFGHGLFSYQTESVLGAPSVLEIGAHNIFLTVLGEIGLLGACSYVLLIAYGFWRACGARMESAGRLMLVLMWISYLLIGLTWHNQFTSFPGMVYVGLLWVLPGITGRHRSFPMRLPGLAGKGAAVLGVLLSLWQPATARADRPGSIREDGALLQNGRPFFPIGLYHVNHTESEYAALAAQGFNAVEGPFSPDLVECRRILDMAERHGLRVEMPLYAEDRVKKNLRLSIAKIDALGYHPAVLAWKIIDEPDADAKEPIRNEVTEVYTLLKRTFPDQRFALTLCQDASIEYWGRFCDLTHIDRYPVPSRPLTEVADFTRLTVAALKPWQHVTYVVQCGWTPDLKSQPSVAEARVMVYLALIHGAKGVFWYSRSDPGWDLFKSPLWPRMRSINAEIKRLSVPLLEGTKIYGITSSNPGVHLRAQRHAGRIHLLVTNPGLQPVRTQIRFPEGTQVSFGGAPASAELDLQLEATDSRTLIGKE